MKLTELNNTNSPAQQVLKDTYSMSFNAEKLNVSETKTMLRKVRGLINESKQSTDFYAKQTGQAYMKLVFMEQALTDHLRSLLVTKTIPRIVVENEEVEKSQVVLAAQDMVDSIQKMIEDVSDMVVKELPALVNGIQSEIGVNESEQFNQQVSEALTGLQATLTESKNSLQSALNAITGQGGMAPEAFGTEMPAEPGAEAGAEPATELPAEPGAEAGAEPTAEMPASPEEPEGPEAQVGRAKR